MRPKINDGVWHDRGEMALVAAVFLVAVPGCSETGAAPGGTGGTGNGGGLPALTHFRPCDAASRAGGFEIQLVDAVGSVAARTEIRGAVRDAADPGRISQVVATDGSCSLIVDQAPSCDAACPAFKDVGLVTIVAVGAGAHAPAIDIAPGPDNTYAHTLNDPYPPFLPGTEVILHGRGGFDGGAFAMTGRGVPSMQFDPAGLIVRRGQPLSLSWSPPDPPAVSRVRAALDVARGVSPPARIECDFPDTGSAAVPAALLDQLLDRGVAADPSLRITRQTVDSTTIAPACVELAVTSTVESAVTVESGP
jgi:hypothetical protein